MKEIPLVTIENNEEKERVTIEVRERERKIVRLHSLFFKLFFLIDQLHFDTKKENDDGKTTSFIFCR